MIAAVVQTTATRASTTRTLSALWKFCASQAISDTSTATKATNTTLSQPSASLMRSTLDMEQLYAGRTSSPNVRAHARAHKMIDRSVTLLARRGGARG